MSRDKALGVFLIILSIIVIIVYGYLMFLTDYWVILLKITAFLIVLIVFAIAGWIGYTLATTPAPKPIEEIEKELEEAARESSGEGSVEKTS